MTDPSALQRLGTVMFVSTICSALVAVPAALRVEHAFAAAWFLGASLAVVPLMGLVALLLAARTGLRAFVGGDIWARVVALAGWLVAMAFVLDRLGETMRAKTHHHALAGVTYALLALAAGVVFSLIFARVAGILETSRGRVLASAGVVAALAFMVALHIRAGIATSEPAWRGTLVDLAALAVGALLGAGAPPLPAITAKVGPVALVLVILLGWLGRESAADLARQGPAYGAALHALGFR